MLLPMRGMMRERARQRWLPAVCAFLVAVASIPIASAEQLFSVDSSIAGRVHDAAGAPLAGALVAVRTGGAEGEDHVAVTDRRGLFTVSDLAPGRYSLRVTKPRFLPTLAGSVQVEPGARLVLTLELQTALDVIRQGVRRGDLEEMKWILRSSPAARPVLHWADAGRDAAASASGVPASRATAAGYLQVYSTAVESAAGMTDTVGSEFAFRLPVASGAQVSFAGQYTEAGNRPTGFTATYYFAPGASKHATLALSMRRGALMEGAYGSGAGEVQVEYDERIQWSDRLVFDYGATIGYTDGAGGRSYLRPELGITWVNGSGSTLSAAVSRRAPVDAGDPIRGREYFDRAVYVPPALERYNHVEVGATYALGRGFQVSVAGFRDEMGTQAFLVDAEDGRRGIVFFDGSGFPTTGVRFHVDRAFRNVQAGVAYTYANAVGFDPDVISPENLHAEASRRNLHTVTARVKTEIPLTQTAVTAVYRWVSGFSLAPVDPYQRFAEYNDPTISITLAQDLPSPKMLPARFQAIVDARNLMEPSFGSRRTVYAGYPRLLKGGIHIRF